VAIDARNPNQTSSHCFEISVNKWHMLYHVLKNAADTITTGVQRKSGPLTKP